MRRLPRFSPRYLSARRARRGRLQGWKGCPLRSAACRGAEPVRQRRDRGLPAVHVIEDDEALRAGALDQEMAFDPRPGRPEGARRRSTRCREPPRAPRPEAATALRVADDAGRVVKIDVHASGASFVDRLPEARGLVVESRIIANPSRRADLLRRRRVRRPCSRGSSRYWPTAEPTAPLRSIREPSPPTWARRSPVRPTSAVTPLQRTRRGRADGEVGSRGHA